MLTAKHFKCSAFLYFLWSIWNHYKVSDLEYNFFASYHGCNGCDGAAAQAAAKVRIFQAESGSFPSDAKELKSILDDLSNHNYTIIPRIERSKNKKPLEFINNATYKGIRDFHQFTFEPNHIIRGFQSSSLSWRPNLEKSWRILPKKFPDYDFPTMPE